MIKLYSDSKYNLIIDGVTFSGIGHGQLETVNQLQYAESPSRQQDGSMQDINEYDSFVLPSLKIGFNTMPIEEYYKLRNILLRKRVFEVSYYDIDFGEVVTHEMYVQPAELKNFFNLGTNVIRIESFTLTFVATLNDRTEHTVTFSVKNGTTTTLIAQYENIGWGLSIVVPKYGNNKVTFIESGVQVVSDDNSQGETQYVTVADYGRKCQSGDRISVFKDTSYVYEITQTA